MSNRYFHFTLDPVQSFVAQARRTRDFWAGSFLLSWLSAVAIQATKAQGGKVSFPVPDTNYLTWLTNGNNKHTVGLEKPQHGCIPNRFKGLVAKVPADFDAKQVVESVQQAWEGLAQAVWLHDLEDLKDRPKETREIWERQVENFWEMSWALTDNEKQSNLLYRRKNWRSYLPPEEAGVKCMMMDGWQELSGIATPNIKGLELFWKPLREKSGSLKSDLRESEYLCAIAFIKRRFAHCFENFSKPMPVSKNTQKNWTVYGWEVNPAVPSVSYMAAAPWLAKVLEVAPEKELLDFHNKARDLTEGYGEYKTNLLCIKDVIETKKEKLFFWSLTSLDGDVFFETALDNKNRHPDQEQAQQVKTALLALRKAVNKELEAKNEKLEPVSPFYAVLMMDGDSLGLQMSDTHKQKAISESLNYFTQRVLSVVEKNSGFLIYAGGDDVLALLPLEYALTCAYELRRLYLESFEKEGGYNKADGTQDNVKSTLSGAIEYAHIKMPLGKILGDAHDLLDDIAKDGCGRDAIAVRVWKPGGQHLQWARPWKCAVKGGKIIIDSLAKDFRKTNSDTPFSNSFFFNIKERFEILQGFRKKDIVQLIAADYLNSGVNDKRKLKIGLKEAKMKVIPLVRQCMPVKRTFENNKEKFKPLIKLDTDAAHLIRFLVNKGVE